MAAPHARGTSKVPSKSLNDKRFRCAERWPSGRRRTPAKGVRVKSPSRVRIPLSPPVLGVGFILTNVNEGTRVGPYGKCSGWHSFLYVTFEKSYASNLTRPKSRAEKRISRYFADTALVLVSTRPPGITFAISWKAWMVFLGSARTSSRFARFPTCTVPISRSSFRARALLNVAA
jgi:hypothetical protein